jgi:hypothetical protein
LSSVSEVIVQKREEDCDGCGVLCLC